MKYFEISPSTNVDNSVPPAMNGKNVKNKEEFFDNAKCGPDKFYDKPYEFDYLVPMEFGDGRENAPSKAIYDYHMWFGEEPYGGWFAPVSDRFKKLLDSFNLGEHRFYNALVLFEGKKHRYYILQLLYNSYEKYIDFDRTIFNNLDSFRDIEDRDLETKHFSSIQEVKNYAKINWGSGINWNYERVIMKPEFKTLDFLTFFNFGDLVSERLKNAIEDAGLKGMEFKELPIPIEFSDEV